MRRSHKLAEEEGETAALSELRTLLGIREFPNLRFQAEQCAICTRIGYVWRERERGGYTTINGRC